MFTGAVYHSIARSITKLAYYLALDLNAIMLPELASPSVYPSVHLTTPGISHLRSKIVVAFVEGRPLLTPVQLAQYLESRVIAPTEYVRKKLSEVGIKSEVVTIGLKRPDCLAPIGVPKRYACAVFANVPHKDVPMYLHVAKQMKNLYFVYVTGPGYWLEYRELLKLPNVVVYTNINTCNLYYILSRCSLYLAFSHAEGFGMPPIEALYFGVPVLAYNIETYRETIGKYATFVKVEYLEPVKFAYMEFDRVKPVDDVVELVRELFGHRITDVELSYFEGNPLADRVRDLWELT